jgi:L-alanine-DL-glutamate epimerase-like enolase superfamily enzyme
MQIDAVDFFYLAMPDIRDIGDGSQDAVLVRVQAGQYTGWGECEASPLVSIAALVCPMSHSACKPVRDSVLGQRLDEPADIARIGDEVRANSLDLLQAAHTWSGIEIALWDVLGKRSELPVYRLLGASRAWPKLPYASQLFGDTPAETLALARVVREGGFRAAKFGWGPFGRGAVSDDNEQVLAAREGLGRDALLLIDAGTVWNEDLDAALQRVPILQECGVTWLEEPFVSGAHAAYRRLAAASGSVKLAGGVGCQEDFMAVHMLDHAGDWFVQIDTGRIGGIAVARRVALAARERGITFVNHTFTSHLALSASLQPYADFEHDRLCEYPTQLSALARALTRETIVPDHNGEISLPERPGLGMTPDLEALQPYLQQAEIRVGGRVLYRTPPLA